MNQSCLDVFYLIMGRTFISNQELAIVQKECDKYRPECKKCRYSMEE
jgi:hypothetical protein